MYVKVDFNSRYFHAHRKLVHGGIYAFRSKLFNQHLEVPNNDPNPGALPRLWPFNGSAAQQWVAQRNSDGTYSVNRFGTNQFLDVANNSGGDYAQIVQWTWSGGDQQRWDVLDSLDGYLKFRHRGTDKLLTADAANSGDIIQYGDFSGEEQKWEPVLLGISEGTYRILPRQATTFALGLRTRNGAAGTQVEQQTWEGGDWQC